MRIRNLMKQIAVTMLVSASTVTSVQASLAESLYELSNFGITMGNFSNSLNQVLNMRSPQEQQQIQQRLEYVERMATQQAYSLETFIAADEALAASSNSWGNYFGTNGNDAAIDQVYQAFKQYQAQFGDHILRATGQFPMPTYERLYIRWKQMPATSASMKEAAKQQFLLVFRSYARTFVQQTQSQVATKQKRFLSALKSIQNSGPFAMNDKVTFDKAFWEYQAMFKERTEPTQGQIFIPEFPYNYALSNAGQSNFVYNQSIYQQAGLNQFGYASSAGMGYQVGSQGYGTSGYGVSAYGTGGYQNGLSGFVTGRYSNTQAAPSYQADQVVPLGNAYNQQNGATGYNSMYGTFAPSTSLDLDAKLKQQIYLKQKEIERSSDVSRQKDVEKAFEEYQKLRDQWFGN